MNYPYASAFQAGGTGVDALTVNAYLASVIGPLPAFNTAQPGSPAATATTADTTGQPGSFVIALPTPDDYYLAVDYLGDTYWIGPVVGSFANIVRRVVAVSVDPTDMVASPPSGAATADTYAVVTGDRIALTAQSTGLDNGIWIADTAGDWTRPDDWATGSTIQTGTLMTVGDAGGAYASSLWSWANGTDFVVDTGSPAALLIAAPATGIFLQPNPGAPPTVEIGTGLLASAVEQLTILSDLEYSFEEYSAPNTINTSLPLNWLAPGMTAAALPAASSINLIVTTIKNRSGASVVITPAGSDTIDGAATLTLPDLASVTLWTNGASDWAIIASHGLG